MSSHYSKYSVTSSHCCKYNVMTSDYSVAAVVYVNSALSQALRCQRLCDVVKSVLSCFEVRQYFFNNLHDMV